LGDWNLGEGARSGPEGNNNGQYLWKESFEDPLRIKGGRRGAGIYRWIFIAGYISLDIYRWIYIAGRTVHLNEACADSGVSKMIESAGAEATINLAGDRQRLGDRRSPFVPRRSSTRTSGTRAPVL
jgi:hypothetical protein